MFEIYWKPCHGLKDQRFFLSLYKVKFYSKFMIQHAFQWTKRAVAFLSQIDILLLERVCISCSFLLIRKHFAYLNIMFTNFKTLYCLLKDKYMTSQNSSMCILWKLDYVLSIPNKYFLCIPKNVLSILKDIFHQINVGNHGVELESNGSSNYLNVFTVQSLKLVTREAKDLLK